MSALAQASTPTQSATGSFVVEVTEATFEETVRQSIQYPVVMEFYSAKAPESAAMGETLAALANAAAGSWLLARLNIDASPQIVQMLQIRAVPMVVGLLGGQLVPLWQGSMPQENAAKVIGELLKMAAGNGILGKASPQPVAGAEAGAGAEPAEDPRYTPAYEAMGRGDYAGAQAEFEKLLAATPSDSLARIGKAQAGLLARVEGLDPSRTLAAGDAEGAGLDQTLAAADVEVAAGDPAKGFARLIAAIASASGDERETLRLRLLELFDTQDPADKVVLTARRNLATALF